MVSRFLRALFLALIVAGTVSIENVFAEVKLSTEVSPQTGSLDDTFTFRIIVEGDAGGETPLLEGGDSFDLQLIGPQSRVTIINGRVDRRIEYVYRLLPKTIGKHRTPKVTLTINGRTLEAAAIPVTVSKPRSGQADDKRDSKGVWLEHTISPDTVYVGQQLASTLELYSAPKVINAELHDLAFDGFWSESHGKAVKREQYRSGKRYIVHRIRHALFPLRPGELEIPARRMTATIEGPSRNPFGKRRGLFAPDFFSFRTTETVRVSSPSKSLSVKPLPPIPHALTPFQQNVFPVGETTLSIEGETLPLEAGESRTFTIRLQSYGNLNPVTDFPLPKIRGAKIYKEAPENVVQTDGEFLVTEKLFRFSLVAIEGSQIVIPELQLRYFDPKIGEYRVVRTPERRIPVRGGATVSYPLNKPAQDSGTPVTPDTGDELKSSESEFPSYQPLSPAEKLLTIFSPGLLLLVVCVGFVLVALGLRLFRWTRSVSAFRAALQHIRSAQHVEEIKSGFLRAASARVGGYEQYTEVSLLQLVKNQSEELHYQVQRLFDDYSLLRYRKEPPSQNQVEQFRQSALSATHALPSGRSPT